MKLRPNKRNLLRFLFLILHPIRSFKHLISKGEDYSKISLSELRTYLDNTKTIIEAGAADGVDTLAFSSNFPAATIFAIEPIKEQYEHLIIKTKNHKNIQVFNLALSDRNEEKQMYVGSDTGTLGGMGSSSLLKPFRHIEYFPEIQFKTKQAIQALTLEKFITEMKIDKVDLLWLDIQGAELAVLSASVDALMHKVKLLHLEISRIKLYENMPKVRLIRKFLKHAGFICVVDRVGAISGNALYLNTKLADL